MTFRDSRWRYLEARSGGCMYACADCHGYLIFSYSWRLESGYRHKRSKKQHMVFTLLAIICFSPLQFLFLNKGALSWPMPPIWFKMLICLYDSTEVLIVAAQTISTRSIGVYTGRQGAKTVQHIAAVCKMQDRAAHNERSKQVPGIHKYICAKHQSPQVPLGHNWKCRQQQSQDPMGFQAAEWKAATGWMTRHRGGWQEKHGHRW